MLFAKKNQLFGLDIGSSSLKMTEIRKNGNGYELLNAAMVPLPPEAIVEGAIMNAPAVVEAIHSLLEKHKPRTRNVATAVSGHSVIIKKISLPTMSKKELEQSIQWEAEQYIPFNIQDVNLDYQILSPDGLNAPEGNGAKEMDLLLVAAKKDLVEDYAGLLREAELKPAVMDVASFAMANMYEANYDFAEDEVTALFNIGAGITNINICKGGTSLFTRDIHFGGNQYNEEIQKALHLSHQDAEDLKLRGATRSDQQASLERILERVTDALLNEMQRSLEFFGATSSGEKIRRVALCGGCAAMAGLPAKMQERLGIEVELMDPFRRLAIQVNHLRSGYLQEIAPFMGVSVGLALRGVGDS